MTPEGAGAWRRRPAHIRWCGRVSHDAGLALQQELHASRLAGVVPDTVLLLEHDSVYTAGRGADPAHFLVPPSTLEAQGHAVRTTSRGGDVTWHGPGQVTCYPILDLRDGPRDAHAYLRRLEDVLIAVARRFGVQAWREPGRTGAWCAGGKIGAVGVGLSRWVTTHGTALNVAPDLRRFEAIVPCGIAGAAVTSLRRETGHAPPLQDVVRAHAEELARVLALDVQRQELPDVA